MTREITHMKAFSAALESMKKPAFSIGKIAPTPGLVNQFFNDSTGTGDEGEIDTRGPGMRASDWEFIGLPGPIRQPMPTAESRNQDGEFAAHSAGGYQ